jgi:DNA-directed RNA polymerase subunit H
MKIDISKHEFVPKQSKLSEKEVDELLKRFNISLKQLPRILIKDTSLEGMDVKVGDIIKIIRKSPTMKKSFFYRVVVNE